MKKLLNGVVVDLTPEEVTAREQEVITNTLAAISDVWEGIKVRRDQCKSAGVKVGSQWFHSDSASRIQWLGLKDTGRDMLSAGGKMTDTIYLNGSPLYWKTMDGGWVLVTLQLAWDVVAATKSLDAMAHAAAEEHDKAMQRAKYPGEYDYSKGYWPETYPVKE